MKHHKRHHERKGEEKNPFHEEINEKPLHFGKIERPNMGR